MYICVKLFFGELNIGLYPPHPTSTYTCEVTIIPRVCGDIITRLLHAWKVGLMMVPPSSKPILHQKKKKIETSPCKISKMFHCYPSCFIYLFFIIGWKGEKSNQVNDIVLILHSFFFFNQVLERHS